MKRYIKSPPPAESRGASTGTPPAAAAPETGIFDVEDLLAKTGEILRREVLNLMSKSSGGKLSPTDARDLVNYVRLLAELKAEQDAVLSELSDEELQSKLISD